MGSIWSKTQQTSIACGDTGNLYDKNMKQASINVVINNIKNRRGIPTAIEDVFSDEINSDILKYRNELSKIIRVLANSIRYYLEKEYRLIEIDNTLVDIEVLNPKNIDMDSSSIYYYDILELDFSKVQESTCVEVAGVRNKDSIYGYTKSIKIAILNAEDRLRLKQCLHRVYSSVEDELLQLDDTRERLLTKLNEAKEIG